MSLCQIFTPIIAGNKQAGSNLTLLVKRHEFQNYYSNSLSVGLVSNTLVLKFFSTETIDMLNFGKSVWRVLEKNGTEKKVNKEKTE